MNGIAQSFACVQDEIHRWKIGAIRPSVLVLTQAWDLLTWRTAWHQRSQSLPDLLGWGNRPLSMPSMQSSTQPNDWKTVSCHLPSSDSKPYPRSAQPRFGSYKIFTSTGYSRQVEQNSRGICKISGSISSSIASSRRRLFALS